MATNNDKSNRVFLYEVVINPKMGKFTGINGLFQRRGKLYIKVPYERMNQEMQRISRLGGKIVNIFPLNSANNGSTPEKDPLPWWVEITTTRPHCIYYFGPFDNFAEAYGHHHGYVEDLQEEGAQGIIIRVEQCQPLVLTQELEEETSRIFND